MNCVTDEQLDQVTGGTVEELRDLTDALVDNRFFKGIVTFSAALPISSKAIKAEVTNILDSMGIEANIDVSFMGVFGFGIGEKHNTYKDKATGESLTHKQVLDRIKNFGG